ncbi:hypothetical protein N1851_023257 [Merluccius polli]|uniref:Uncharacterized protein n=1 Tax=Merluccius polli TaxID=89951 RepID=A0AA47MGH9_MERPO|nr:hypothetical protein N1851_023257 [Merluccius polli]
MVKAVPDSFEHCDGFPVISSISEEDLKQQQRADPAICEILRLMETGETPPPAVKKELPELPIFLREMNKLDSNQKSHSEYVRALKTHLQESYQLASKNAAKTAARNKIRFDRRVTESTLDVGDRVLVRSVRLRGKHKLADKWEETVHVVVSWKGDLPVYTVKPEIKDGPLRTLHRDLLLPCGFLPASEEETTAVSDKPSRPRTRQHPSPDPDEQETEFYSVEYGFVSYPYYDPVSEPITFTREYTRNVPSREQPSSSVEPTCTGTAAVSSSAPEESGEASSGSPSLPNTEMEPGHLPEMEPVTVSDQPEKDNLPEQSIDPPVERTEHETETTDAEYLPETSNGTDTERCSESEPAENGEATHQDETVIDEDWNEEDGGEIQTSVRRSTRQREPSRRLTYNDLGNPLVTIVQTLFQSLSTAVTKFLLEPSFTSVSKPKNRLRNPFKHAKGLA